MIEKKTSFAKFNVLELKFVLIYKFSIFLKLTKNFIYGLKIQFGF